MSISTTNTISDFAGAVRAELADLTNREIQELTEGLEADLEERLAEENHNFSLGSPTEYAIELRDAAGISPQPPKRRQVFSLTLTESIQGWFNKTPAGTLVYEFALALRPVWWILRAVLAWYFVFERYLNPVSSLLLLFVLIFLSIQWGLKKWFTNKFFAAILLPLNLLALILLIPAQDVVMQRLDNYSNAEAMLQSWPDTEGLRLNGEEITDIKAFDVNQQEITGLTFTDQNGSPIETPGGVVETFFVPDILGMSLFEATTALNQANIPAVDFIYLDGANETNSFVVKVEPSIPGNMVTELDTVTVTLGMR